MQKSVPRVQVYHLLVNKLVLNLQKEEYGNEKYKEDLEKIVETFIRERISLYCDLKYQEDLCKKVVEEYNFSYYGKRLLTKKEAEEHVKDVIQAYILSAERIQSIRITNLNKLEASLQEIGLTFLNNKCACESRFRWPDGNVIATGIFTFSFLLFAFLSLQRLR